MHAGVSGNHCRPTPSLSILGKWLKRARCDNTTANNGQVVRPSIGTLIWSQIATTSRPHLKVACERIGRFGNRPLACAALREMHFAAFASNTIRTSRIALPQHVARSRINASTSLSLWWIKPRPRPCVPPRRVDRHEIGKQQLGKGERTRAPLRRQRSAEDRQANELDCLKMAPIIGAHFRWFAAGIACVKAIM